MNQVLFECYGTFGLMVTLVEQGTSRGRRIFLSRDCDESRPSMFIQSFMAVGYIVSPLSSLPPPPRPQKGQIPAPPSPPPPNLMFLTIEGWHMHSMYYSWTENWSTQQLCISSFESQKLVTKICFFHGTRSFGARNYKQTLACEEHRVDIWDELRSPLI